MDEELTRQRIRYLIEHGGIYPPRRNICCVLAAVLAISLTGVTISTLP